MQLPVKTDYAARAVLALARQFQAKRAVRVEELASRHGIPAAYLLQILISLKSKGIVKSRRGKEGGYLLARAPAAISLGDILRADTGKMLDIPAIADPQCPPELREGWRRLVKTAEAEADRLTFQTLLDEAEGKMYYI